jgi:hypothetical protein
MTAVESEHAGVASGINNAVARVAGLVGIAMFGLILVRGFDSRIAPALDQLQLPPGARAAIDRELPKLAGADVARVIEPNRGRTVRQAVDESFIASFRLVMIAAAAVALVAAVPGALIPRKV